MPAIFHQNEQHTEEVHDIITKPPSWLLKWGILLLFTIFILIFSLAAIIKYPDIIRTQLKIRSANSPKPVVARSSGIITQILVREDQEVIVKQPLAYLESTADHKQVVELLAALRGLQQELYEGNIGRLEFLNKPSNAEFGELQENYQGFFQDYLKYKATITDGFYHKKKKYLQNDLYSINQQKNQLEEQQYLQQKELELAEQEYDIYRKNTNKQAIAVMELKKEESKVWAKKYSLHMTKSALITNRGFKLAKEKEIMELDYQIREERASFNQSLNSLISKVESWKSKYILSAPQSGTVSFVGIIQENQFINDGTEIFYVNSGNTNFFGEMAIPQYSMGRVRSGQDVLIKLKSYPYEEYGMLKGQITYIADVPYRDSVFVSRVKLNSTFSTSTKKTLGLKNGMMADAEIITQDASVLERIFRSVNKIFQINK